jgi:twinkle protein
MSFVAYRKPCPECGGSDPVSINEDGSAKCFSCDTYFRNYEKAMNGETVSDFKTYKNNSMNNIDGEYIELRDRKISLATAKKYGVKAVVNSKGEIVKHYYPYYTANEISGYKIREPNKLFSWQGQAKESGLFGQQAFNSGGKYVTLTEGECDAMAAYELLGSKWPVLSVKNGAGGAVKDVKQNLEFLEKFDNVVISFDNDKVGKEAARKVAKLLTPGKARILTLSEDYKDPNDMLRQGLHQNYVTAWWASNIYTPAGVLNLTDNLEKLINREKIESVPYPWSGLNEKLYGMRRGELITLTGGTGLGKSSITRELEHWLLNETKDNVGIIALEENWKRTADGILSIEANERLYIEQIREEYGDAKYKELANKVFTGDNENRLWIHAHYGATDFDDILSKIRYMIIGCNCKWIIVDHLHMLVMSAAFGDERTTIDNIMGSLSRLVEETNVGMVLVSHLRRVEGNKGHEQGVAVGLSHLRGSASIAQVSDCVIALERDQQAEDPQEANTTHMRILKSRYTGDVGMATHLLYDKDSGRLREVFVDESSEELEL